MQTHITACLSALDTLGKQESRLYQERAAIPDRYHGMVREIQRLQDEHHDICEMYGYDSREAIESNHKHTELNEKYFNDRTRDVKYNNERLKFIMNAQRAIRASYRKKLGDIVYMANLGSDYELNEYFRENGILRSTETDYNKKIFVNTYTLNHTKTIEEYAYFIEQMIQYFEPNTYDKEAYRFKVGYTRNMYLEFRDEWWHVMHGTEVLFEDPFIIEALKYMEIAR